MFTNGSKAFALKIPNNGKNSNTRLARLVVLALALALVAGCGDAAPSSIPSPRPDFTASFTAPPSPSATALPPSATPVPSTATPTSSPSPTPLALAPKVLFAAFAAEPVEITPIVFDEQVQPEMSNVSVPLVLTAAQLERLERDGVVSSPVQVKEFNDFYWTTYWQNLPMFITSDSLLHSYHLVFDKSLKIIEENILLPKLRSLNASLLAAAKQDFQKELAAASPEWQEAGRRVIAYLAVADVLSNPDALVPESVAALVEPEVEKVMAAAGPNSSAIFPLLANGEDYSQYRPRGHYTKSEELQMYFRAMMWYGRMTFRLSDPVNPLVGPDETRPAILLTWLMHNATAMDVDGTVKPALALWADLYDPVAFLIGRSDDLTVLDYQGVLEAVAINSGADVRSLADLADDTLLENFRTQAAGLPAPRILGLISEDYKPLDAVKGLRLLGQRFTADGYMFQELIHPKVAGRYLPSGLDVLAVMGSERALEWTAQLEDPQATGNPQYAEQIEKLRNWTAQLTQAEWTETVYNGWLFTLQPLLDVPGPGYPRFMQSVAWQDKQLNTALGSWAELKHDTLLYAKQPYGGRGGGGGCPEPPSPALAAPYVEPVPQVYARIAALAQMTYEGLEERGLIPTNPLPEQDLVWEYTNLVNWALLFKKAAENQLNLIPATEEEQENLRSYYTYLDNVVRWYYDWGERDPAAIIADVATDPNSGQALEVGIGRVHELYVIVPQVMPDGSIRLEAARGGVFSYYEFPSATRLTDEEWRAMIEAGQAPPQPKFTSGFTVPEAAPLQARNAIYAFQILWARVAYFVGDECDVRDRWPTSPTVRNQLEAEIQTLRRQGFYEGRKWLNSDYLSASQDNNRMTVTVRESWLDYRVSFSGDPFAWYDAGGTEPVDAWRGPYDLDVRYTLEQKADGRWVVVNFELLTSRPAW